MDGDGDYGGYGGGNYGGGSYGDSNQQGNDYGSSHQPQNDLSPFDDHRHDKYHSFNEKRDYSPFGKDDQNDDSKDIKYSLEKDDDGMKTKRYAEDEDAITPYEESTPDGALTLMLAGSLAGSLADGMSNTKKGNGSIYPVVPVRGDSYGPNKTEESEENNCALDCLHIALTCCQCTIL